MGLFKSSITLLVLGLYLKRAVCFEMPYAPCWRVECVYCIRYTAYMYLHLTASIVLSWYPVCVRLVFSVFVRCALFFCMLPCIFVRRVLYVFVRHVKCVFVLYAQCICASGGVWCAVCICACAVDFSAPPPPLVSSRCHTLAVGERRRTGEPTSLVDSLVKRQTQRKKIPIEDF